MMLQMTEFLFYDRVILHIFFIHSSVDEHLGCFHIFAIINNVGMNIEVHITFKISLIFFFFFFWIYAQD